MVARDFKAGPYFACPKSPDEVSVAHPFVADESDHDVSLEDLEEEMVPLEASP